MGRYMDTFSLLEGVMRAAVESMLGLHPNVAMICMSVVGTRNLIDLVEASAKLSLNEEGVNKVRAICEKIKRRNMRRNHIVHGYWIAYFQKDDQGHLAQWIRRYDLTDPNQQSLDALDPKLLGVYTFTVPALDKATGHVKDMVEELYQLVQDIPSLRPPQPSPEQKLRMWAEGRIRANAATTVQPVRFRFPR